jgi:hypothetical protein
MSIGGGGESRDQQKRDSEKPKPAGFYGLAQRQIKWRGFLFLFCFIAVDGGGVGFQSHFLRGIFDEEETLIVAPGMSIAASFDEKIIKAIY